jgi:hypothetical protein
MNRKAVAFCWAVIHKDHNRSEVWLPSSSMSLDFFKNRSQATRTQTPGTVKTSQQDPQLPESSKIQHIFFRNQIKENLEKGLLKGQKGLLKGHPF